MTPRATYRVQFQKEFGFDQAAGIAGYLAQLGISHLYASPYLKARPGSLHGYDIVDHNALNPELGGDAAFRRMAKALQDNGLRQILDFVPNHMGVCGADNPLWLDVLEWGRDSAHAGWFDIDWDSESRYLHRKVLVPVLANQYGVELEAGKLTLRFDADEGAFAVWAYGVHKLPICPVYYARILGDELPEVERLSDAFSGVPEWRPQVVRRAADLKQELAQLVREREDLREAVSAAVARINGTPGDYASWQALDELIRVQHWRVAHFRAAGDVINYRRFFNINELAGLRMELPEVFDHTHRLVFRLLRNGTLDGLRIDHIDGLLDPKAYLERLRAGAFGKHDPKPFYLVVEKILARHESLREDWPVEGTTGYDFANQVLALLVDSAADEQFTRAYMAFTAEWGAFPDMVRDGKIRIMENEMASELNVLAHEAERVAQQNPRTADFTHNILRRAICEIVACFPVYRTYVDTASAPTEADRRDLDWGVAQARRHEDNIDPSVFDFLYKLLSGDLVAQPHSGFSRHTVLRCAMKLQQYSGAVMAKGLEDTAFYRYCRFIALNEVGGYPEQFGAPVSAFHKANGQRARRWPNAMLSTSTHDTKRGEDTRARLAALSELPDEWRQQVEIWSRILRARRGDVERTAPPYRNDEYLFYQLLAGTWPAELTAAETLDRDALRDYMRRLQGAMIKSVREAKQNSKWEAPDTAYEAAVLSYVEDALDPERSAAFLQSFLPFQERLARLGVRNSLVQTTLKFTVPGVPDIYQGAELWDFSLMDPDNRRPVDYALRCRLLEQVRHIPPRERVRTMRQMLEHWQDGAIKLAITAGILQFRGDHAELFSAGTYEPLRPAGARADQVCAFVRRAGPQSMMVAAALFPARLEADAPWAGTTIPLPDDLRHERWENVLTGVLVAAHEAGLNAEEVFHDLPVAVLAPKSD